MYSVYYHNSVFFISYDDINSLLCLFHIKLHISRFAEDKFGRRGDNTTTRGDNHHYKVNNGCKCWKHNMDGKRLLQILWYSYQLEPQIFSLFDNTGIELKLIRYRKTISHWKRKQLKLWDFRCCSAYSTGCGGSLYHKILYIIVANAPPFGGGRLPHFGPIAHIAMSPS